MDAGSDLTRKARAKRAMLLGCEMRLWHAHVFDGKNQALYVREPIDRIENFHSRIVPIVAAAGLTYADCVASTADVALHHRSLSTLHALYRRRVGRGAKQAEMLPAALAPDDSAEDSGAGACVFRQLVRNASDLQEDTCTILDVDNRGVASNEPAVVLPETLMARGHPFIAGFKLAHATKLLGVAILTKGQGLTLRSMRIVDAAVGGYARFCVTASVQSSGHSNRVYQQRFFVFMPQSRGNWYVSPVTTPSQVALCTCRRLGQCKHYARALLAVCEDSDLLGDANTGVPMQVHTAACWLVHGGVIPRTTPAQRQQNSLPLAFTRERAPRGMDELWAYGYISPAYADPPDQHRWHEHNGDHELHPIMATEI